MVAAGRKYILRRVPATARFRCIPAAIQCSRTLPPDPSSVARLSVGTRPAARERGCREPSRIRVSALRASTPSRIRGERFALTFSLKAKAAPARRQASRPPRPPHSLTHASLAFDLCIGAIRADPPRLDEIVAAHLQEARIVAAILSIRPRRAADPCVR